MNFNGTGTPAIRDDFNVSSIGDNGTGDYTVNFSSALPNSDYCVVGISATGGFSGANAPNVLGEKINPSNTFESKTTGSCRVFCVDNDSDTALDSFSANALIFGS